jgi:hypothetical protein
VDGLHKLAVDVRGIPELIWSCRCELARLLRQEAEAEVHPLLKRRLSEIANRFEAGQS